MSSVGEHAAALAGLPQAGSVRLARLLHERSAVDAWQAVIEHRVPLDVAPEEVREEWYRAGRLVVLDDIHNALRAGRVEATCWHDPHHPQRFTADLDPAPVAFRQGRLPDPSLPHVAVVGTRRASTIGREIARELGAGLSAAGVVVVSGLALGIDGAAHRGVLLAGGAPPLGVVGSGADVVYPSAHRDLWNEVAVAGAVLTEAPLGAKPEAWRFPARNRLIVALVDLVVVVESRAAGGSLLTVEQAMRRGIDVMAVPGSLRNDAAIGTNQLLADGCAPVRDVDDVLVALGLSAGERQARRLEPGVGSDSGAVLGAMTADTLEVLEAIDDGPTSVDQLVRRLGIGIAEIHGRLGELSAAGLVTHDGARVRRA